MKSFTLMELVIVVSILVLLFSFLIIALNPIEMLRRGNDTQRLSNANDLVNALSAYVIDKGGFGEIPCGTSETPCDSRCCVIDGNYLCTTRCLEKLPSGILRAEAIDGSGWIPLNFQDLKFGAPFSKLPLDPSNRGEFFYRFGKEKGDFEVDMAFESYDFNKIQKLPENDGGNAPGLYEKGTKLDILGPRIREEGEFFVNFSENPQIDTSENIVIQEGVVQLAPGTP